MDNAIPIMQSFYTMWIYLEGSELCMQGCNFASIMICYRRLRKDQVTRNDVVTSWTTIHVSVAGV